MLWCGLPAMSVTVVASITITMIASMSIKLNNSSKRNNTLCKKRKKTASTHTKKNDGRSRDHRADCVIDDALDDPTTHDLPTHHPQTHT